MNTRQEKTIKTNEISSTMQCVTRSGKRKGEVGRIGSEPADGHQLMACSVIRWKCVGAYRQIQVTRDVRYHQNLQVQHH